MSQNARAARESRRSVWIETGFVLLACVVPLVMRAYLVTRFEQLLRSTPAAVLLSTALFAAYHGYQGKIGLMSVALFGLVYGLCFARWRRIWPLIIAHALQDFVSIALLASRR
jgi:membrane protease YdiL (CAAX protease family)